MTFDPPVPPYLGPAAHTSRGNNKPIHRVVIHSTVSPCVPGGARSIAAYFRSSGSGGSAHYVVDPSEVVQVVLDDTVAWHAPPNPNSLGIEMCDEPSSLSIDHWQYADRMTGRTPADDRDIEHGIRRNPLRFLEKNHRLMLRRTAKLTAELCLAYDVPVKFLSSTQLRAGEHGITTHANVSKAWSMSTHWDPGLWPKRAFMRQVRRFVAELEAAAA